MIAPLLAVALLGSPDRMARFHGTAEIELIDGTRCIATVRSEDLATRGFVNRWHYLLQPTCDLGAFGPEVRHNQVLAINEGQRLHIGGWGTMTIWPLDPEVRSQCTAASEHVPDYPTGFPRTITIRRLDPMLWEILIEEPQQ